MNYDNYSDEGSCLNAVNITSNVRAPGEYKYYYCGENNSSSDKSFLSISTMWYTTKISEDMFLLSSCYTPFYTCLLYYCPKKSIYNIYIYQNYLDYKSENISLKAVQLIQLEHSYKTKDIIISKSDSTGQPVININVKIYFGADNYILLNEIDRRILLIDFFNGNYVTIFNNKESKSQEPIYNIIDTYDENYFFEGELRLRTYAFLSIKYQEKKLSYYKYRYFIIERGILENSYFFLHSIDLDMGNGEPLGIKIAKIPKQTSSTGQGEDKNQQWFYILCFLSSQRLFQLITNYDKLTLYQMLRNVNQCNVIVVPTIDPKVNSKSGKSSMTTIGLRKDNQLKKNQEENKINTNEKNNNEVNNQNTEIKNTKQICFWSTSINLWLEKKQVAQSVKIFLNMNTKRLCALILFFEMGEVATFPFNYNDSPEEIKNKITITAHEIQLDKIRPDTFGSLAKVYKFQEHYFFKSNTICALTSKNLILAIDNKFRIYDLETNAPLYSYNFYKENIASFLLFDDIGATFLLTWTKVFKIIFNTRYKVISENEIKNNPKCPINAYQQENLNYPIFEDKPEDIWNSYCNKLEIDSNDNRKYLYKDIKINNSINTSTSNNKNNENDKNKNKVCVICSKDAEYYCSDCELKFYCGNEHFKYDYNNIHFYECQLVQFFKRKDIMSIENKDIRYIVLYNELIKLCGRILNFMFTRIFVGKDCHIFLEMLLNLISLLDNFGFNINFAEFCSSNLFPSTASTDKKSRAEKILFFQECIYFYVQLQILKCTFTSKCKLYNLTDCYLKIIKNDIIPKLTPKSKKKIIPLRCDKLKKNVIFQNEFFQNFQSPVFFDLKKAYINAECTDYVDIVESYIMKHLMALSILVKFKIKLHSSIDVKDTFVDISLMFDDHFREIKTCKNVAPYCYFSISFYLVEIGKVPQTVKLLKKMESSFSEKSDTKLKALTYYNLGVLQYALGEFKIGIHNIEEAYKLIVKFFLSEKFKHRVMVSLGLAYLNQRNLFKAYVLIQKSIRELKKIKKQKYELKCIKLNVYLNYIIDLYEYSFITKARLQTNKNKNNKNYNIHQLINFVQGEKDKELIVIEQHVNEFLKVVEYIWNLPAQTLQHLQNDNDNPSKQSTNYREEVHHEKNLSFTLDKSQMSTFLIRETGIEKEESQLEYDEDIEVKPQLFDSLTRQQQKDFKELKTVFLKRDIILRDSLGEIEKFNINYDPVYSVQFQKIIEKLKSNFLLKDIFYCFQNEKWRDELYNYSPNSLLFGLSKYLKLEKIKNVIAIEKSKCLDMIKKEKNDLTKERKLINKQSYVETDLLKKINIENNIYPNNNIQNINNFNNSINTIQNNNMSLFSRYKNEEMNYIQFKKRFSEALKENEKNKNEDKFQFFNLKDDYLVSLYKNVYLNNPEHDFIFQNPSLILNYIFIDISNNDTSKKEANELILKQKIQEDENKNKNRKSNSFNKNNTDTLKEEESKNKQISKFAPNLKTSNNNNNNSNGTKEINNIFDKTSKMIISPILENIYDLNNYNKSSSETVIENYIYLKFDEKEDNLEIVKEIELSFIFIRKKVRSVTSSWGNKFIPSFGKKKKIPERKSCLPDLFLKFSNGKTYNKIDNTKKLLNASENVKTLYNRKGSVIAKSWKINSNLENNLNIANLEKKKKKKKEKSAKNLHERLSINFNIDMNEIVNKNNDKNETSSESEDLSQSKTSNVENNKEKNSFIEENNEKEESDNNIKDNNSGLNDNNKNNEDNLNIFRNNKKDNNIMDNSNINTKNSNNLILGNEENNINNNNYNNNIIFNQNDDNNKNIINNNNNIIFKFYDEKESDAISNKDETKNMRKKTNKSNEIIKNNSVKLLNNKNNSKKRYKNLIINTKKGIVKPKTYNYFSPENIRQEEDENINNFYGNKKISFYSMSQKKLNKNYGFKNKKEQEKEIFNGAFEYLQNEFNNKNIKNIKGNHIINSSGISIPTLKNKFKMIENQIITNKNKNNYKVPYDYKKKGKQFGEESTISLNSTSSGLFILNNNFSIYEEESSSVRDNFQEELHRIINFNKKMKSNGKDYNFNNIISNKKFKKSVSQSNFFDKNKLKILESDDKMIYSKGKPLAKTNKNFTPVSNIFKKSLNKTTNTGMSTSKNINLNGNQINSFNNINYSKFNIKSSQNKNQNIINSNSRLNKENNQKNYVDYYQDDQKHYQKNKKKENKKTNKIENDDHEIQDTSFKFRFVLDKYLKKQKPINQQNLLNVKNNKEKENIQNKNIIKDEISYGNYSINGKKEVDKIVNLNTNDEKKSKNDYNNIRYNNERNKNYENYQIKYNENNNKIKNIINNYNEKNNVDNYYEKDNREKSCDSFFDEGINNGNLCDLNVNNDKILDFKNDNILDLKIDKEKNNKINNNDIDHINIFEDEKINISNIKQSQDSNLYSKNSNEIINENNLDKNIEKNDLNNNDNNIYNDNNIVNNKNNIISKNNDLVINNSKMNNKKNIIMKNDIFKMNNLEKKSENSIIKINELNNGNLKNLKNDKIENINEDKSFDSSCNGLGEDTNIIDKINLPFSFSPLIKNINNIKINNSKKSSKNIIINPKNNSKDLSNNYLKDSYLEN